MKNLLGVLFFVVFFVLSLGLSIGVAFWIGSSDLPLWVKFLLLK